MFPSSPRRYSLRVLSMAVMATAMTGTAHADSIELAGGYHAQVTNFFCAAASAEMALDVPAVRNANAVVDAMLNAGDGGTVPGNSPLPLAGIQIVNGVGVVTPGSAQAFIYGLNHGLNTINGLGYASIFSLPGSGTDSQGLDVGLNLLDNPNVNGVNTPAFAFGSHAYSGFNLLNQGLASRTIANALNDFSVPAVAAINNGSHAISVYGVETDGAIGRGLNYTIKGFYVHDPWTGWAVNQLAGGVFNPGLIRTNGGIGLGYNTYLRYGVDADPANGPTTTLPNGNMVNVTLAPWTRIFNASPGQLTPNLQWTAPGFKFEVEPIGPETVDVGDPANDFGFPAAPPNLPSAIASGSSALTSAMADLAADAALDGLLEHVGGAFDVADASFMQTADESGGEGDWLIPYDGAGGINDITGAVFVDAETGMIDEATWVDMADPNQSHFTLDQLDEMFFDQEAGILPIDNVLPEPTALAAGGLGVMALVRRRRRA